MMEQLRQELLSFMQKQVPVQTQWVTVTEVDADAKTMNCQGISDALTFFDVPLSLGNFTKFPKVNSKALIGLINNQGSLAYMIDCAEFTRCLIELESGFKLDLNATEILLNGDSFGGLTKHDALVTQLNILKAQVSGIIDAIASAVVAPGDGGATFKTNLIAATSTLPAPDFANLKNNNVKHG